MTLHNIHYATFRWTRAQPGQRLVRAVILAVLAAAPARADAPSTALPPVPVHEQILSLPSAAPDPVPLQVTLFTPEGPGPFPLAVMLHGASGPPKAEPRYRFTYAAGYFLSRGYAVAQPMMRGFAGSAGALPIRGCDFAAVGRMAARDIGAVIAGLAATPGIDTSRVVVAGQSFGGWNALALSAQPPPQVRGVILFSAAIGDSACPAATRPASLIAGAHAFGAQARLPTLWFYGENDSLTPSPLWRLMLAAYRAGGGQAQLADMGRVMSDSHQMLSFPETLPQWTPIADAFLARNGLDALQTQPGYLPLIPPRPSGFAALRDTAAPPNLTQAGRQIYAAFLSRKLPRAFVLSPDGTAVASDGGFDPLARAMQTCLAAGHRCVPYAVDNDVVWQQHAQLSASGYATLQDIAKVPYLMDKGRADYRRFLSWPTPRAFAIAPGGWSGAQGGDAAANALGHCQAANPGCSLYAVNNAVVWRGTVEPVPAASGFAALDDFSRLPVVADNEGPAYRAFLTWPAPRAFVLSPEAWFAARGDFAPAVAMAQCRARYAGCALYAVDGAVVWRPTAP